MTTQVLPAEEQLDPAPLQYVGLATRAVAAAIDAALVNGVVVIVGLGVSLIASLLVIPHTLRTILLAIGGAAYVAWVVGYFVAFWSSTGQTPGDRIMMIRVVTPTGDRVGTRRALLRCGTTLLAALPLFAGFLLILFDGRRRALNDVLAATVVIDAPGQSIAEVTRNRRQAGARAVPAPVADPPTAGVAANSSQSGDAAVPTVQDRNQRRDRHASLGS